MVARRVNPGRLAFIAAVLEPGVSMAEAARRAGYQGTSKSLSTIAARLVKEPAIAAEIRRGLPQSCFTAA